MRNIDHTQSNSRMNESDLKNLIIQNSNGNLLMQPTELLSKQFSQQIDRQNYQQLGSGMVSTTKTVNNRRQIKNILEQHHEQSMRNKSTLGIINLDSSRANNNSKNRQNRNQNLNNVASEKSSPLAKFSDDFLKSELLRRISQQRIAKQIRDQYLHQKVLVNKQEESEQKSNEYANIQKLNEFKLQIEEQDMQLKSPILFTGIDQRIGKTPVVNQKEFSESEYNHLHASQTPFQDRKRSLPVLNLSSPSPNFLLVNSQGADTTKNMYTRETAVIPVESNSLLKISKRSISRRGSKLSIKAKILIRYLASRMDCNILINRPHLDKFKLT
eukprot:403357155